MGMFIHAKSGVVYLYSKSDPRWNCSKEVDHVPVGVSEWHTKTVAKLTAKYGEPPADLEYGGERD